MAFSALAGFQANSITEMAVPLTLAAVMPDSRRLVGVLGANVPDMDQPLCGSD